MSFPRAVTYLPGAVAAVVADGVALLVDADPAGVRVGACRDACARGGIEALLGVLGDPAASSAPDFALVASDGDGRRLVVRGRARIEFAGGVAPTLTADGAPGWCDRHVDEAPDVRLTLAGAVPDPAGLTGPQLPIEVGVVLAAALVVPGTPTRPIDPDSDTADLVAAGAAASEAAASEAAASEAAASEAAPSAAPVPEPAAPEPVPSQPPASQPPASPTVVAPLPAGYPHEWLAPALGTPPGGPDDAPLVSAVSCADHHLNAPFVVGACRVCGAPVPAQTPFLAPRPTLGVLVLASGEAVPVDKDVLLGRAPFAVDRDSAHIVTLPSPNNDLSRTHVRVAVDGWLVQVTDLGSTNGTVVTMPGQQAVRLRAHDPFVLVPGTVLNLADEALVRFEVPR